MILLFFQITSKQEKRREEKNFEQISKENSKDWLTAHLVGEMGEVAWILLMHHLINPCQPYSLAIDNCASTSPRWAFALPQPVVYCPL
jgi:hypothetical protein